MRLTCPNCGAIYALGAETVPQGGSHVQCGACHTRWFVRAERPVPAELSEAQIVARLEGRAPRSESASGGGASPASEPSVAAPIAFPGPTRPVPAAPAAATPDPADPARGRSDNDLARGRADADPARGHADADFARGRADAEPKPEPAPLQAAAQAPGPAAATPLRPRQPAERPPTAPPLPPPAAPRRSAAPAIGFLAAIGLAALGLAAYLRAEAVTVQAPPAAGGMAAFVATVDAGRGWIEARLGPARDRLFPD